MQLYAVPPTDSRAESARRLARMALGDWVRARDLDVNRLSPEDAPTGGGVFRSPGRRGPRGASFRGEIDWRGGGHDDGLVNPIPIR